MKTYPANDTEGRRAVHCTRTLTTTRTALDRSRDMATDLPADRDVAALVELCEMAWKQAHIVANMAATKGN